MLETTWFVLWGLLWAVYFMLDGFDLGLGMLMPLLARNDQERRIVFNAMGPFWDGNEVWLIAAGGVTFAAFPPAYATLFSTLYTPLMLLLVALILRGVSFELRSKDENRYWRGLWDTCMTGGSFVAALLLGVAFANIFAGLPFDAQGVMHGNLLSLLNPYGLLGGLTFLALFGYHGSLWLGIKAEGELGQRGEAMARRLWPVGTGLLLLFVGASAGLTDLFANYLAQPLLFGIPALAVVGAALSLWWLRKGALWRAWGASGLTIVAAVFFGLAGIFPRLLPSSLDAAAARTAFNSASSPLTLAIMLGVALALVPLVIAYQSWVYWRFRAKVQPEDLLEHEAY